MNRELLLDAVGHLDVGLIEKCFSYEAALPCKAKRNWGSILRRVAAVAACLCIAFIGALYMQKILSPQEAGPIMTENGVYIPPKEFYSGEAGADVCYCVAYGDRVYFWQNSIKEKETDLVGDALGTGVTSDKISIDLYEVKGYSPEFMVCDRLGDEVQIFVCDSGMTLKKGKDLFGDRMHLAENVKDVYYAENEDAPFVKFSAEAMPIVRDFLDALYVGEFAITRDMEHQSVYGYCLAFEMENGLTFYVDLSYGGYASFRIPLYGSMDVCIPIEKDVYATFIDYLTAENGVYIPPVPETRKNDGQDHMTALPMVSYNGQIYIMDEVRDDNGMVGEELGEGIYVSYEMLNEYTFTEELVFYNNSSYKPKIYEVEGYSYEFLICEKLENEQICVYIRHSDMTVKYGKDLFGDYMHLKENLKEESFFGENKDANSVEMIAITDFFDALYEGEFIVCKRNDNTFDSVITSQKYILSFPMQNDINFSVVLSSAGYAWWYLHWEDDALVCVPIDEEVCQRVIKTVEKCYD